MDGMSCLRKLCFAHFRLLRLSFDSNVQARTFHRGTTICQRNRPEKSLAEGIGNRNVFAAGVGVALQRGLTI